MRAGDGFLFFFVSFFLKKTPKKCFYLNMDHHQPSFPRGEKTHFKNKIETDHLRIHKNLQLK